LTLPVASFLTLNLLLIAMGIGSGRRSARLSGLIPLGIFVVYNFSNAFARTSGGRYLVPMDWIVVFYFALGLFQITLWGMALLGFENETVQTRADDQSWNWMPLKKSPLIVMCFLLLGASIPLSEQFFPRRYTPQTSNQLIEAMEQKGYLQKIGLGKSSLSSFSSQTPGFRIVNGRALNPRSFWINEGIPKNSYPYMVMDFPRTAFTVIGSSGASFVILPRGEVPYFPDASDVIVLGCQTDSYIDAMAVVVISDETVIYNRQPASLLQCPLPQPVCDENQVCQ
jgi:hypothetical protein